MEDAHEMCNVWLQAEVIEPAQVAYNLALRRFRHAHPWLRENLSGGDRFNRIHGDNATLFYGHRQAPDGDYGVVMVAHMGGAPVEGGSELGESLNALMKQGKLVPVEVTVGDWLQLDPQDWRVAIAAPGTAIADLASFTLTDSQAVLLEPR